MGSGRKVVGPLRTWLLRLGTAALVWTALLQMTAVVDLWQPWTLGASWPSDCHNAAARTLVRRLGDVGGSAAPPPRAYRNNGYLRVSCNGGLNQMRAAICDMVTVARYLNLTLLIPELDKSSFWADTSDFGDIFDTMHFINSLRDEVRIIEALPKNLLASHVIPFSMSPISWSSEKYYLEKILPIFQKHKIVHFNRTDARLANNGLPLELQRLRCRVNYEALKFTPRIQALGEKLVTVLKKGGFFVVLHLRYEMDMLSFSGCTHGCSDKEATELTRMRYAFPWWKEKEIVSEVKRLDGLCPLTPEEITLVLQALGFSRSTQIYIASGEIYGGDRRLRSLRAAYPNIVRKEMLLCPEELRHLKNHSSQMAALDYLVSVASDVFIPSYDGNMAKVVEGHRRHMGFRKTISLNRKELVRLFDLHENGTISWEHFRDKVQDIHKHHMGQPTRRKLIPERPKEEDYFYANPEECLRPLALNEKFNAADT